jgi:hypothetical protein
MDGIRLIKLLDVLQVTDFENAPGVEPRSLVVEGVKFENVDTVLINGNVSPFFAVYSPTQLVAEVPADIADAVITEVTVLSGTPTYTARSMIELTVGSKIRKISGTQRLVQTFIRQLLRTTGTNIFHKTTGGSLVRRVGSNIDQRLAADIAVSISTTRQSIIAAQTPERSIPASERLLSAEISNLTADPANAAVYVTIILTSHAGQRSAATLVA